MFVRQSIGCDAYLEKENAHSNFINMYVE